MTLYSITQPLPLGTLMSAPPTPPPDISIHIQGNNTGNIYAGNRFNTTVGAVAGDLITLVTDADIPLARPRPRPVDGRPRDFAGLIGRATEIRSTSTVLAAAEPVEIYAGAGMGKTSLLRYLAWRLPAPADGVYHLRAVGRPPEDIEEQIFAGFFDSQFPIKQYHAQLLEHLRPLQALIIVDDLSADRDALADLLDAVPHCAVLLASDARRLWSGGQSLALPGLSPDEGTVLFAATLGRRLTADEQEPVRQLCIRLSGNPLAIVQAAAAAEEDERALLPYLRALPSPTLPAAVAGTLLGTVTSGERRVLSVLAALDGASTRPETLVGALGEARAEPLLAELAVKGLVEETEDGRYCLAAGVPLTAEPEVRDRLAAYLISWAQSNRDTPAIVGQEVEALRALLDWSAETGRPAQVLALARALDPPLTLAGQWATWDEVMDTTLHAARVIGEPAALSWVLHQQGSRALLRDDAEGARTALESALMLREQSDDTLGAHLTQYHLDLTRFLFPPPSAPPTDEISAPKRQPFPEPRPSPKVGGWRRLLRTVLITVTIIVVIIYLWPRLRPPLAPPELGTAVSESTHDNSSADTQGNPSPDLRILEPTNNAHFPEGTSIRFRARAQDDPNGDLSDRVLWEFARDGMERSADFRRVLPPGRHVVPVTVVDDDGQESWTTLVVYVDADEPPPAAPQGNPSPDLRILEPANNAHFPEGTSIRFRARAQDDPNGDLSDRVLWEFARDGMERSADFRRVLPPGRHVVPVTVVDDDGQESWTTLVVYVDADEPPPAAPQPTTPPPATARQVPRIALGELSIVRQTANGAVVYGTATANDAEDGPLNDNIQWWLGSRQNVIGYGPVLEIELPPGEHLIVVFVADSDNMGAEDERRVVVLQPAVVNTPPRIEIKRPLEGQVVRFSEAVALSATATDDQEDNISSAIVWRSSINDELGRGPDLIVDWLQPGLHTITAEVTDAAGASASATTSITVGTDQPDLVAELTQTGPGTVIIGEGVYILVPVRLSVDNVGGTAAEGFMISAGGEGPGGRVQTTLVDMSGSDGRRVWIGEGMVAGQRVTLDGMLRIDNPAGLYGQVISVWVMADNCAGDEFVPQDVCRVPESNEDNNRSPRIQVTLPPSPLE